MFRISDNSYGASQVRLLKVTRRSDRHEVKDVTVSVAVEGDFTPALTAGDNREMLDPRTMENAVFALAKDVPPEIGEEQIEHFGRRVADYFLDNHPQLARARVDVSENSWSRLPVGPRPHHHAFCDEGSARRTTRVDVWRERATISSGFEDLMLLRTVSERFEGYKQDPFATGPGSGGMFACRLSGKWIYRELDVPFALYYQGGRQLLLEAFAEHEPHSPQHLLYAMGEALLSGYDEIREVQLVLEQFPHMLADLSRFGLENRHEVFQLAERAGERFKLTVRREAAPDTGPDGPP
jgi:urate oxidase